MAGRMQGKVAFVTGGGSGIGAATVRRSTSRLRGLTSSVGAAESRTSARSAAREWRTFMGRDVKMGPMSLMRPMGLIAR